MVQVPAVQQPKKRKARTPLPADETSGQKLVRLASARVPKAIKQIAFVGNLAAYKPTQEQVLRIMKALDDACEAAEARLKGTATAAAGFSLS
jgi:hypothetical protein